MQFNKKNIAITKNRRNFPILSLKEPLYPPKTIPCLLVCIMMSVYTLNTFEKCDVKPYTFFPHKKNI